MSNETHKSGGWPVLGLVLGGMLFATGIIAGTFGMQMARHHAEQALGIGNVGGTANHVTVSVGPGSTTAFEAVARELNLMMFLTVAAGLAGAVMLVVSFVAMRRMENDETRNST